MKRYLLLIPVIALGIFVFRPTDKPVQSVTATESVQVPESEQKTVEEPLDAQTILELVNAERAKVGVKPLVIDDRLNQSAQAKCDDMSKFNEWEHVLSNGNTPETYINRYYGEYEKGAENLALNTRTPEILVKSWLNSKTHKESMLSSDYVKTGFGICYIVDNTSVVNLFVN